MTKLDRDILRVGLDRSIAPSPENISEWLKDLGVAYQRLEQPGELARTQAALAELTGAARHRLVEMVPYVVIPLSFLMLALLIILAFYFVRTRRPWFAGLTDPAVGEESEFHGALQALVDEARELQRQRGERPLPRPKFLLSRGAFGDAQVCGSSRRPVVVLTRAMSSILRREIRQRGKPYTLRAVVFHELAPSGEPRRHPLLLGRGLVDRPRAGSEPPDRHPVDALVLSRRLAGFRLVSGCRLPARHGDPARDRADPPEHPARP